MIPRYGYPTHPPGVTGLLGPDKDSIPTAWRIPLGVAPMVIATALGDVERSEGRNDLGDAEKYPVSKGVTLDGYRQILLQTKATDGTFDRDYTVPNGRTVSVLQRLFPDLGFYRARLLILDPGHEVPWHVDASPREFCRIHMMIQGTARWLFRRRGETQACRMKAHEIWWTSVGWPHSISNDGDGQRIVLIIHADWDRMVATFGEPKEDAVALPA